MASNISNMLTSRDSLVMTTVCSHILTLTLNSLSGSWRHFCSGVQSMAHCGYC